jgi:UTP--glucose-1-phosphate uridylyltransferase
MTLRDELAGLSPAMIERLAARGFDAERLTRWAQSIGEDRDRRNRLPAEVEPPAPGDVTDAPIAGTEAHARFREAGLAALRAGEVALCVMAGGMATRMGGVVKALVEALPGRRFLDLRLAENEHLRTAHRANVPLWLMTSEATDGPIREALAVRADSSDAEVITFEQFVSLRLTPDKALFREDDGQPSVYATGHGDLPDALRKSGLLSRFRARGGRVVWIANLDNLGATVDPAILGWHLSHRAPVSVEVVDKLGDDRGGVPVRFRGRRLVTEEFRLPLEFDPRQVRVFNTNTFLVDAAALDDLQLEWTYVEVEKKIAGRSAVQFERLVGEITAALEPRFLRVPRTGTESRFLPVKDVPELEKRRPEIEAVARARGMV